MSLNPEKDAWNNLVKALKEYSAFDSDYDYVLYRLENEITLGGSEISANLSAKPSSDEILSQAISHYGEPFQLLKCVEELAELGSELADHLTSTDPHVVNALQYIAGVLYNVRDECKSVTPEDELHWKMEVPDTKAITSELADVSITTQQMLKIFTTPEEFEKAKRAKLSRLAERMRGDSQ
jgi:hypothetical protein